MDTKLRPSRAAHPQTDGQSERTIQILEDMLRACMLDFWRNWDKHMPLVEFSYNNSYQFTIGKPPLRLYMVGNAYHQFVRKKSEIER